MIIFWLKHLSMSISSSSQILPCGVTLSLPSSTLALTVQQRATFYLLVHSGNTTSTWHCIFFARMSCSCILASFLTSTQLFHPIVLPFVELFGRDQRRHGNEFYEERGVQQKPLLLEQCRWAHCLSPKSYSHEFLLLRLSGKLRCAYHHSSAIKEFVSTYLYKCGLLLL